MPLTVPELSLVVLVGASGAGKSTFAARHFRRTEVLSSDHYRGVVSDDETDQSASRDAFEVLEAIVRKRLARGLLTVVDATNVDPGYRKVWVQLAKEFHVLPVAIVLDVDAPTALARNATRADRQFGPHVVRRQISDLRRGLGGLRREGFRYVHHPRGVAAIGAAVDHRPRAWPDFRDDPGPFDLIGDVHGCFDELCELLRDLGYTIERPHAAASATGEAFVVTPPPGRRALFLGDLVDRGPASNLVLRLAMDMVDAGVALCVPGNHEAKLLRWLQGKSVKPTHGTGATIEQLSTESEAFRQRCATFIDGLVSHFVLDGGALVVAHAGMRADLQGRASGKVREFALYGETTGEVDEFGLPVRYPWARDYEGRAVVVYGHTPVPTAEWLNRTICLDTGCVFGGELTALRWPERELVSVRAAKTYFEPVRPLHAAPSLPEPGPLDGLPNADDVLGGRAVVSIRPDAAAAALEVLARFAEDPRWLVHLPPTMSPVETSTRPDLLEHPDEAFAHYRGVGVDRVVCQEKHMGSRAVVVLCRDDEVCARRFGFRPGEAPRAGIVLTRRGRRFFDDDALEGALLDRLRRALDRAGTWAALSTDWAILDAELLPWSSKARSLLETQYAPVGTAARAALGASVAALRVASARQEGLGELLARTEERLAAAEAYTSAWRRYVQPTDGLSGHRLAPFHLLASEGAVHDTRPHAWHLDQLDALVAADEELLLRTERRFVDLADDAAVAEAARWWEELTAGGGEGVVVKPAEGLVARRGRKLVQPALKVRGREYLRVVYGPEYTLPEHLARLRQRGTGRKRALAERELVLGLEALHRFVERRPLRAVHAAVFAILALESEPVDPRL